LKFLLLSGQPLGPSADRGTGRPWSLFTLLPYFFFLNALICLLSFRSPFCVIIALVFTAWGATNLLFRYCHRCRDALARKSVCREQA